VPPKSTATTAVATTAKRSPAMSRPAITVEYVEALQAYSTVLFKGGLCPSFKGLASRPELVAAIIEVGKDLGLPPTQALANVMIVRGKPAIYGDAALALIRSSGLLEDFEESYEGKPGTDQFAAVCRVKRKGAARERISKFSVADAKRAKLWGKDGPWSEYTERQMMFRARSWACRDEFGDVLCGLAFVEEAQDAPGAEQPKVTVTATETTTATPTIAEQLALPAAAVDRESLYERLAELRESMFVAKGIQDDEEARDSAWAEVLANYNVESATQLADAQLVELVEELTKVHGVFG